MYFLAVIQVPISPKAVVTPSQCGTSVFVYVSIYPNPTDNKIVITKRQITDFSCTMILKISEKSIYDEVPISTISLFYN